MRKKLNLFFGSDLSSTEGWNSIWIGCDLLLATCCDSYSNITRIAAASPEVVVVVVLVVVVAAVAVLVLLPPMNSKFKANAYIKLQPPTTCLRAA